MRIAVWNIENFSFNKATQAQIAAVFNAIFFPAAAMPVVPPAEINVIIEVYARFVNLGGIPAGTGANGLVQLLAAFVANQPFGSNYVCVPPVSLATGGGRAEAIGIIYDANAVTFRGPHVWTNVGPFPANQIPPNVPVAPWNGIAPVGGGPVALQAYPAPWNAAPFNQNPPYSAWAPQIDFVNNVWNTFVDFPQPGYRRPLRAQFTYGALGANTIDLWVVHLAPQLIPAAVSLQFMMNINDFIAAPGLNEIKILCGDFNLDANNGFQNGMYFPITNGGYAQQINPPFATITHFTQQLPTYQNYLNGLSIDNALVNAGGGIPAVNVAVVDVVAGAAAGFPTQLNTPLGLYPLLAAINAAAAAQTFRAWNNFGHIGNRPSTGNMLGRRGSSDHLPLILNF